MTLDLELLIPNIIMEDINKNSMNTYISQLAILTIKSLLPIEQSVGNKIDYIRFKEELKLWEEYCIGENISLLNTLKSDNKSRYLNYFDETYYTRLIPIIIANKDFGIIEEEIIKNVLFFSGNIENLFEWLLIGVIIYLLIDNNEDIIYNLKEYIINFSQKEFMDRYKEYFQIEINTIPNTFKINFEKERITLLNIFNDKKSTKYHILMDLLRLVNTSNPSTSVGKIVYNSCKSVDFDSLDEFYININKYILNLRKGRIDLEDLKINEYVLPDVFRFEEGDVFFHSLLNYSKVLKKEVSADGLTSLISTKSGNYLFKRDPSI